MNWWEYRVKWRRHMNAYKGNQDVNTIEIFIQEKRMKEDEKK